MTLPLFRPFPALRPAAGRAGEVVAPPYDVLDTEEARRMAEGRPWSFLHISKPEIDLPSGTDPYAPEVYARGAGNIRRMVDEDVLVRDEAPGFYVYRLTMGEHVQTGVVGGASVAAYDGGRIRRHELTRPSKEDDRVRQIEAVGGHTGPVMIANRPSERIREILATETARRDPDCDVTLNGVGHAVWAVSDAKALSALTEAFEAEEALYIADGHHRSNAAIRVAKARRAANSGATGTEWYESFLAVVFPADEMRILDYNRVVSDLNGLEPAQFLTRIEETFSVEAVDGEAKPGRAREFGLYVDGRWYRLTPRSIPSTGDDVAAGLDVGLLSKLLLEPVLGIGDPRLDPRVDFVGGIRGLGELKKRVDSGDKAAAFAVYPTSMEDLMAVSDAGQIMPPKSTWFEPKLADGLASLMLD